ncbi:MAG: hypothetical protein COX77_00185, partial [Candidatus Komeilibacteria bacterium CG_4_10_14_0_2_um_filter_37_10]
YTDESVKQYKGVNLINLKSFHTKNFDAITHTFLATMHALGQDFDVLHYQGVGPSLLSLIPRIFKPSCRVVVTFHSLDRNHAKWSKLAKLILWLGEWTACHFPHQTVTVSKGLQSYCLQKYNTPTTYIPNGVYSSFVSATTIQSINKKYNLEKGKYLITVARFVKHKRIDDVIQAFSLLTDNKIKLVIVGGSAFTSEYTDYLHQLGKQDKRIKFIDYLPAEKLFPLMAGSMGFVSASEDEGMPITILEALSLGVPLVVSDIEGHRELFDQCHSLTFNVGDIKKLKLKMDQLIQQKAKWQKITKKNQLIINEQYNWEDIAKSLNTLYKQEIMAPQSLAQTLF